MAPGDVKGVRARDLIEISSICSRSRKTGSCTKVLSLVMGAVGGGYFANRRNNPACWALVFACALSNCCVEAVRPLGVLLVAPVVWHCGSVARVGFGFISLLVRFSITLFSPGELDRLGDPLIRRNGVAAPERRSSRRPTASDDCRRLVHTSCPAPDRCRQAKRLPQSQ